MGSEKSLLKKVAEKLTNRKLLIILTIFFLIVTITLLLFLKQSKKTYFYPPLKSDLLKPLRSMFKQKDYLNVTSYVDSIIPSLNNQDKVIALFYKAESYFQKRKLGEAWKIYFKLSKENLKFWQTYFRIGCIAVLKDKNDKATLIFDKINYDVDEVLYWKGLLSYKEQRNDEALEYFNQVLIYPKAVFFAAKIFELKNKPEKAIEYFQILINKNGELKQQAMIKIINILEKSNQYKKSLSYIKEYEKDYPHDLDMKRQKGLILYKNGYIDQAYQLLSSQTLAKKDKKTYSLLGKMSFEMGRFEDTVKYYGMIDLNKEQKKQYIDALMKIFKYKEAKNIIQDFIKKEDVNNQKVWVEMYHRLIECNLQLENLDEALKYAGILIKYEETADNYLLISKIYRMSGNREGYIESLKKATSMKPKFVDLLLNSLIQSKNLDEARIILNKILKKDPYHETALFYKAKIEYLNQYYHKAKISLYTLIYLPPKKKDLLGDSFYMLGSILFFEKDYPKAENMFRKVIAINSNSIKANLRLISVLMKINKKEEAKKRLLLLKSKANLEKTILSIIYALLSQLELEIEGGSSLKVKHYLDRSLELDPDNKTALNVLKKIEFMNKKR